MSDWKATAHPQIQVRPVYRTADELPLREYRHAYKQFDKLPPDRRDEPIFSLAEPLGYQVRVKCPEEPPGDGEVRCEICRRVFAKLKSGEPWRHMCVAAAPGWRVARALDETPAKAEARGRRMLNLDVAEQTAFSVGDGKCVA